MTNRWLAWILSGVGILAIVIGGYWIILNGHKPKSMASPHSISSTDYQVFYENRVQDAFEQVLNKMVGQGNFHVSVIAIVDLTRHKEDLILMSPYKVTVNSTTESQQQIRDDHPAGSESQDFDLPGFFGGQSDGAPTTFVAYSVDALPGFPSTTPTETPKPKVKSAMPSALRPNTWVTTKQATSQVFFNRTQREIFRDVSIKNWVVSIVIDENVLKESGFNKDKLILVLEQLSPIDKRNGDILTISFLPFKGGFFSFSTLTNWRPIFGVGLGIGLLVVVGLMLRRVMVTRAAIKQKALDAALMEAAELKKKTEQQEAILEDEKKLLLAEMDAHPEVVAHSILDWMDSFSKKEEEE